MDRTRLHFDYGKMHLSIDPRNGSFLELYTTDNYDNLIKNSVHKLPKPFSIFSDDANDGASSKEFIPIPSSLVIKNKDLSPIIDCKKMSDGLKVKVFYPYLWDGVKSVESDMYYTAFIKEARIEFSIYITNVLNTKITRVRFPLITGLILGYDYSDNILVMPRCAGIKITNPVKELASELRYVDHSWQEYKGSLNLGGNRNEVLTMKGLRFSYPCGGMSMSWLDIYNDDGGIYYGVHDKNHKKVQFEIASGGETFPGLSVATTFYPIISEGESYQTPQVLVRCHKGDWHEGAKTYREFRQPLLQTFGDIKPFWLDKGNALYAHYDFMWQNHVTVHKFKDINSLVDQAVDSGINHLLFSGWNKGGFDEGYPEYTLNEELGTEQEFIDGVKYAKEKGVHISVYMNISLHNEDYQSEELEDRAVIGADGKTVADRWGNHDIKFVKCCPNSKSWQKHLEKCVKKMTKDYGVDGVYFDMLSTVGQFCFNKKHDHHFDAAPEGIITILDECRKQFMSEKGYSLNLMGEWVTDLYGNIVNLQLHQSWLNCMTGNYPEVYRYTFPTHGIVDMLYPFKNLAMRSPFVSSKSENFMADAYTNGSYFWVYDIEEDCTFKRDKEGYEKLMIINALTKELTEKYSDYLFVDNDGIKVYGEGAKVTRFVSENGKSILRVYRFNDKRVTVKPEFELTSAVCFYADGKSEVLEFTDNEITLPDKKAFYILLS